MAKSVTVSTPRGIRPQSLVFTLYGDYIHARGDRISIRSLIKLLTRFGVSEQAVRTTVSRMTRRGWLMLERQGNTSFYVFTPRAKQMIEEGKRRIFGAPRTAERWNHCWHLVTYSIPEEYRQARDEFRRELNWLGYGMLTNAVWLSPRNRRQYVEALADRLTIKPFVQTFSAESEGFMPCAEVAAHCWDLGDLNQDYGAFIARHAPAFELCRAQNGRENGLVAVGSLDDAECFARRFRLIHEYRQFPYRDPYLPLELLPQDWRGWEAAALFRDYHDLLAGRANHYFEQVYQQVS